MKSLIICISTHHGNTQKIAKVMAKQLKADLVNPSEVTVAMLSKYNLIGFGSGIYNGKHHQSLFTLLKTIPKQKNKTAFIFSTNSCGAGRLSDQLHKPLKNILKHKNFLIIGEFCCKGFMNYSFTKWFNGGVNKEHPNKKDLEDAASFVKEIL